MATLAYTPPISVGAGIPLPTALGQVYQATGVGTAAWTKDLGGLDSVGCEYVDLTTGLSPPAYEEGRLYYDSTLQTLAAHTDVPGVKLAVGQRIYNRVYNNTGNQINKGELVYSDGNSVSGIPTVSLARADSAATLGEISLALHNISIASEGFTLRAGTIDGLNTNLYVVGTKLYLSASVSGSWTLTPPTSPDYSIEVATVVKQDLTDGEVIFKVSETNVSRSMTIEDVAINEDLKVGERFTLSPTTVANITAAGGITVTNSTMRIQGSGGAVSITANPQIAAGYDGEILHLHGSSDTNTVTIHDGDGVHIQSGDLLTIGDQDHLQLQYNATSSLWEEVSSNFQEMPYEATWGFATAGSKGIFYNGGFYLLPATSYTPATGTTLGSINVPYGAHAFIVLGATSTNMVVRVTGTSVDESGNRVTSDTQDLDTSGGVSGDYFETTKKWVGQVSLSLQSGTGVIINHGLCKYWDNGNTDFNLMNLEVTGVGGKNDTVDFELLHHKTTGWTYNVGGAIPPTALASMQTDYSTESDIDSGIPFAWKRVSIDQLIQGSGEEGLLWRITTTKNGALTAANMSVMIDHVHG